MKGCTLEANLEGQGVVTSTVYQFLGSNLGLRRFEKKGTSEKRCIEIEHWGFSVHFVLGFQENSI